MKVMSGVWLVIITLAGLAIFAVGWLEWQLLRQNGRILLRLDELEQRLNELEFGDASEPERLGNETTDQINARAHAGPLHEPGRPLTPALSPDRGEGEAPDRGDRFRNRSLARSKLKRDGLKAGTLAPDFRLPRLDGHDELSLEQLRGRPLLLVFSDPHCGPCNALAPELEKFHRQQRATEHRLTLTLSPSEGEREAEKGVAVVMISRGDPKENRAKVKEHGLTFPIVLQQHWEISRRYAMFATPIAYLIDEAGVIEKDVAVGVEPIQALLAEAMRSSQENAVRIS
jgi:peroxiredoxin